MRVLYIFCSLLVVALQGCGGGNESNNSSPSQSEQEPTGKSITLSWYEPTSTSDGTCLSTGDIQSYRVKYRSSDGSMNDMIVVPRADMVCQDIGIQASACGNTVSCSHAINSIPSNHYYFSIQAIDSTGNVGEYSDEIYAEITP